MTKTPTDRASSLHTTQVGAQTRAREILSHDGGGVAVTHRRDGSVLQSDTVVSTHVDWSVLSPQGHVLFFIALCPGCTTKDIARAIGHSERQIWSMVQSLKDGGMLHTRTQGRRHHFSINYNAPLLHPTIEGLSLRSLLEDAVERVHEQDPDVCSTSA